VCRFARECPADDTRVARWTATSRPCESRSPLAAMSSIRRRPEVPLMSLRRLIAISILMVALASVAFAHDDPVTPARGTLAQTQPATPPATPTPATQPASFDTVQIRTEKGADG